MKDSTKEKMEELKNLLLKMEELKADMDGLKIEIHEKASELKKEDPDFVMGMSKVPYEGIYYSIRSKFNPDLKKRISFVCTANRPFGSWLKKDKSKLQQESSSEESE